MCTLYLHVFKICWYLIDKYYLEFYHFHEVIYFNEYLCLGIKGANSSERNISSLPNHSPLTKIYFWWQLCVITNECMFLLNEKAVCFFAINLKCFLDIFKNVDSILWKSMLRRSTNVRSVVWVLVWIEIGGFTRDDVDKSTNVQTARPIIRPSKPCRPIATGRATHLQRGHPRCKETIIQGF